MFNINPLWVFKLSFYWKLFSISLAKSLAKSLGHDENPLSSVKIRSRRKILHNKEI